MSATPLRCLLRRSDVTSFFLLQVLNWIGTSGDVILQRHTDVSDNLLAIRRQQRDFDRDYVTAMVSAHLHATCLPCTDVTPHIDAIIAHSIQTRNTCEYRDSASCGFCCIMGLLSSESV